MLYIWIAAGSTAVDHSGTKDGDDSGFSQRKQEIQCKSPEARGTQLNYTLEDFV